MPAGISYHGGRLDPRGKPRCTHCALPIPAERRSSEFCCAGCEAVHALLRDHGLTRFYVLGGQRRGAVGEVPGAPRLDWLPELIAAGTDPAGIIHLRLDVQGIRCAACVWLLQELWRRTAGGLRIDVDPGLGRLDLLHRGEPAELAGFLERLGRFGYRTAPTRKGTARDSGLLVRLGICAALAMNAMIVGFAQHFGLDAEGSELSGLFRWVALALGTGSVAVGGPVFFRAAMLGLRNRVVHMDLPIALGILLAWAGSVATHLSGGAAYFDTVAVFVAFMVGGRYLQQRTLQRNRDQVLADDGADNLRSHVLAAGEVRTVPVTAVRSGDELLLRPGDLLPVRARPRSDASFSLDWINGESEATTYPAGAEVPAGAFHAGNTAVRATATADYLASGLADLLQTPVTDREDTRDRIRFWELLNRWYAVGVLVLAAVGAGVWLWLDPAMALPVAVAILVVTCPCALGLATPLAFHLALSALRRRGIFVRSGALLDKLRRVRQVVFDKTGTVTLGRLQAECPELPSGGPLAVLATMVASSNHPASRAIEEVLPPATPFLPDLTVREVAGRGLVAVLDGVEFRLGSPTHAGVAAGARRESVFSRNGVELARFALTEEFRAGAAAEVAQLQAMGLGVHLFSGDRPDRVTTAAARLGIAPARARGGMSPEAKAAAVAAMDAADTLMVGDGLNDAPAFAAAFCAGTPAMDRPVLPGRADFCYVGAQSGAVLGLLQVAALLHRVVRANLVRALLYNATVVTLSLFGLMTPLLCAVLMPISSAALVLHTGRRFAVMARRAA